MTQDSRKDMMKVSKKVALLASNTAWMTHMTLLLIKVITVAMSMA